MSAGSIRRAPITRVTHSTQRPHKAVDSQMHYAQNTKFYEVPHPTSWTWSAVILAPLR
ncbi:hypothetical protein J2W28_004915 [Variovorax boronicumulans]|nr:hypothetical protein [Variovorax boronicumulans]MDQ0005746.1 hypothetical protein [Variovorax boronicumulans]